MHRSRVLVADLLHRLAPRAQSARFLALVPILAALGLAGCDPRDCALGIAHRDCYAVGAPQARFPQDDAVCRSYGLAPGSKDYAACRRAKRHERALTNRETDFGVLQNPLTPDVRPIYPVR